MDKIIIKEMKKIFKKDSKRIKHALKVLNYAKKINLIENGDPAIVNSSAILHDIGIKEAEKKYGSSAGVYQEKEGPPLAKKILESLGFNKSKINHVCKIIANHHSALDIDTTEFKIIWDADWLVNIKEEGIIKRKSKEELITFIEKILKTKTGKKIAKEKYIK
jgi:HD superfamily phosphodiesterase